MATLKFTDWDKTYYSIDESLGENIHNWLSKNFGGKISEIDGILADIVRAEKEYSREWEKLELENDSMKSQIESGNLEDQEEKDFRKKIKDNSNLISVSLKRKIQKVRVLDDKVDKIVKGNPRLSKYWDLKKAEADLEIIENLYKISKNLFLSKEPYIISFTTKTYNFIILIIIVIKFIFIDHIINFT